MLKLIAKNFIIFFCFLTINIYGNNLISLSRKNIFLKSKNFNQGPYIGVNIGHVIPSIDIDTRNWMVYKSLDFGIFSGYKFNKYINIEFNADRISVLENYIKTRTSIIPFSKIEIYIFHIHGIIMFPIIIKYQYIFSLYGKIGYGGSYNYGYYIKYNKPFSINNSYISYDIGFGININWISNINSRLEYSYYQNNFSITSKNNIKYPKSIISINFYYNL